jgi:hypothetical protein
MLIKTATRINRHMQATASSLTPSRCWSAVVVTNLLTRKVAERVIADFKEKGSLATSRQTITWTGRGVRGQSPPVNSLLHQILHQTTRKSCQNRGFVRFVESHNWLKLLILRENVMPLAVLLVDRHPARKVKLAEE